MKICISAVALAILVLPTRADEGWDDTEEYEDLDIEEPADDAGSYGGGADGYDLDDPSANHRAEAIRRDEEGDLSGAVDAFGAAVKFDPKNAGACVSAADPEPVPVPAVLSHHPACRLACLFFLVVSRPSSVVFPTP